MLEGQYIGRYRLLRRLGSGGMGEVYLAEDQRIGQQAAIKLIRVDLTGEEHSAEEESRLFMREVIAIARLDHPNILPLFDYGQITLDETLFSYLVMPYRPEGSLARWLRQANGGNRSLTSPEVAHLVEQASSALQHAHDRHIIHQDVKPDNFLVRMRQDQPALPDLLLADFGIARLYATSSSMSQNVRGTPAYMAPELWESHPVPASDQYALAIMAYQLLTGRTPFRGRLEQVMRQHMQDIPPPPTQLNPALPKDVDSVLQHALAKRPDARFASINAFARAFRQSLAASSPGSFVTLPVIDSTPLSPSNLSPSPGSQPLPVVDRAREPGSPGVASIAPPPPLTPDHLSGVPTTQTGRTASRGVSRPALLIIALVSLLLVISSIGGAAFLYARSHTGTAGPTLSVQDTPVAAGTQATIDVQATADTQATVNTQVTADTQRNAQATATAAATASSPYGGTLTLDDSLVDNSKGNNWPEVNSNGEICQFTNAAYVDEEHLVNTTHGCWTTNTDFTDIAMQVKMTILTGDYGGLIFRGDIPSNQFYHIDIYSDGHYIFYAQTSAHQTKTLQSGTALPAMLTGYNQSNLIAVVMRGNALDFYVNGQHVVGVTDGSYSHGHIGLVAGENNDAAKVAYNDLKVWQL